MGNVMKEMSKKALRNYEIIAESDFEIVEQLIQECAAGAVRDTRLALKHEKTLSKKVEINEALINKIITCYQDTLGSGLSSRYITRVKDEFLSIIYNDLTQSCHNQAHYDLILPIIFFRCIMLNEFNPDSVNSRVSDLEAEWLARNIDTEVSQEELSCYVDPGERDAEWENRRYKWIKSYDSDNVLSVQLYQLDTRSQEFHDIVSTAEKKAIASNLKANEVIPLSVRIAFEGFFALKDQYMDVKKCSEYARIGCFLYDLLKETENEERPLDTILRLYMVPEIHDVLKHTSHIIKGRGYPASDDETPLLLRQFYIANAQLSEEEREKRSYYINCVSDEAFEQTVELIKDTITKKKKFLAFHNALYENFTFENIDLLKFCLDKTILEPCIDLNKTIEKYAKAVKPLVDKIPHLEKTAAYAQTAIRMTKLFREDQVQKAWENSEDYAVRQEVKELFGI